MFAKLSNDLAEAVAGIAPSLLSHRTRRGNGTLFAVDAHHAIGSAHSVRRLDRLELPTGEPAEASIVGLARGLDLALVRVEAELTPVRWADPPRVGNLVLPIASGPRATLGLISHVGGPWRTGSGQEVDSFLDVDGSLGRGFSGGPLLDASGAVLGMNTRRLVRGGTTLPAATVQASVAALLARGSTEAGYLGIGGATATLTPEQAAVAGQEEALLVVAVEGGSPAQGLLTVGDIVLAVDGTPIGGVHALRAALDAVAPGSQAELTVLVGASVEARTVTLGSRPASLG
jgi:S1-C subfamily serine protease